MSNLNTCPLLFRMHTEGPFELVAVTPSAPQVGWNALSLPYLHHSLSLLGCLSSMKVSTVPHRMHSPIIPFLLCRRIRSRTAGLSEPRPPLAIRPTCRPRSPLMSRCTSGPTGPPQPTAAMLRTHLRQRSRHLGGQLASPRPRLSCGGERAAWPQ